MTLQYLFDDAKFGAFGEALQHYRQAKGVSKTKLGLALGRDPSYFTRLENGERENPSFVLVISIIFALGLSLPQANTLLHLAGYAPLQTISEYRPTQKKTWGSGRITDSESGESV